MASQSAGGISAPSLSKENVVPLKDSEMRKTAQTHIKSTLFMEAGAGTGKTHILIERIFSIIEQGLADIDEIAAITFTEKAAAEMVVRLRDRLERTIGDKTAPLEMRERCRVNLKKFERNKVSTIHSFCKYLLQEKPFEAGVDPSFNIDDELCRDLFESSWNSRLEDELQSESSPLKNALRAGVTPASLLKTARFIYDNRDLFEIPYAGGSAGDYSLKDFIELLKESAARLSQLAEKCSSRDDKSLEEMQKLQKAVGILDEASQDEYDSIILSLDKFKGKGSQKNWYDKNACKEQKEIFNHLGNELCAVQNALSDNIFYGCVSRIQEFIKEFEEIKFKQGLLDFQDLLIKAKNLVMDHPSVRSHFKKKLKYILLDEFQDTDPLQSQLVFYLAEELAGERMPDSASAYKSWDECVVEEGRLFLVGDPKQSIYRFRRADIEIYEKVKTLLTRQNAQRLEIIVNFRSRKEIIQWVNSHFIDLIKKPLDGTYQPDYISLDAHRTQQGSLPPLFLITISSDVQINIEKVDEARKAEAAAVAVFIKDLVKKGYKFTQKNGQEKILTYRDIAVLFPRKTSISIYEDAFIRWEIPYLLEAGREFFNRPEIIDLMNILKALDNPCDETAVVSVLKSPAAGLADNDILRYYLSRKEFNYLNDFNDLNENSQKSDPVSHIFTQLAKLHKIKGECSITTLIEKVLEMSFLREYYILASRGYRASANIEKFMAMARGYETKKQGTLRKFVREIEQKAEGTEGEADAALSESGTDAVVMITMHKSKGLEFPVVIPVNMFSDSSSTKDGTIYYCRELQEPLQANIKPLTTSGYEEAKNWDKKKQEAESIRLMYVALTRARDSLAIPKVLTVDKNGNPLCKGLQIHLSKILLHPEGEPPAGFETVEYCQEDLEPPDAPKLLEEISPVNPLLLEKLQDEIKDRIENKAKILQKGSKTIDVISYSADKDLPQEESDALKIGSLYHKLMEEIDFHGQEDMDSLIKTAVKEKGLEKYKDVIKVLIKNTLESDILKLALECKNISKGRYYKEYPFIIETQGVFYEGIIDLLIQIENNFIIVDYKSDRIDKEHIPQHSKQYYSRQAEIYKKAVESMFPHNSAVKVVFYYARADVSYEYPV